MKHMEQLANSASTSPSPVSLLVFAEKAWSMTRGTFLPTRGEAKPVEGMMRLLTVLSTLSSEQGVKLGLNHGKIFGMTEGARTSSQSLAQKPIILMYV
jgi:hypothetical protein